MIEEKFNLQINENSEPTVVDILIQKARVSKRINEAKRCKDAFEKASKLYPEGCIKGQFYKEESEKYGEKLAEAQSQYADLNNTHKKLMSVECSEDESQM